MCDMNIHNALSLSVGKIETLSRLSPLGTSDRETLMVALTVLMGVRDFLHAKARHHSLGLRHF
jgi:hypothetical protein